MGRATIRISLKTIAFLFPVGSMERVYLHGKWQIERGRKPSMNYGNHPTPKEAFAAVDAILGNYFDDIRRQNYSRWDSFWNSQMIAAVLRKDPVHTLPSVYRYR